MFRKKMITVLLCLTMLLPLAACGKADGYVQFSSGLPARELCVGCREGDPLLETLRAALQVRIADGTEAMLAQRWFGKDICTMKGNAEALNGLELQSGRVLIMGFDASSMPFAGMDEADEPQGYEIELAESVCALLGWELRILPIECANVAVELASGEVDCVWGGISLPEDKSIAGFAYMKTDYVFISLQHSHVRKFKQLQDKNVSYPQFAQNAATALALEENTATAARLSDTDSCFAALISGRCDAVLTDAVAASWARR